MAGITLQDLSMLGALAERRSFRAAAAQLGVSPSSLSHAVAAVERRLGVRLFNRTTRSVALTEAGEQFLARVRPALRDLEGAVEAVNRFRDTPAGLLRLNASEGGAERILPAVLSFLAANPDMRVDLVSDGRLIDIVAEGFDAGVRGVSQAPQDMVAIPLGIEERFLLVASPDYLAREGRPDAPPDLLAHNCLRVRMPSGVLLPWEFERRGETVRIDPPARLILGSPNLASQAAVAGAGVGYLIERVVAEDLAAGRLVTLMEDWTPAFPGVCLYYPRQRLHSAGLAAFIEHVRSQRRRG